jgi:hypothetical protein
MEGKVIALDKTTFVLETSEGKKRLRFVISDNLRTGEANFGHWNGTIDKLKVGHIIHLEYRTERDGSHLCTFFRWDKRFAPKERHPLDASQIKSDVLFTEENVKERWPRKDIPAKVGQIVQIRIHESDKIGEVFGLKVQLIGRTLDRKFTIRDTVDRKAGKVVPDSGYKSIYVRVLRKGSTTVTIRYNRGGRAYLCHYLILVK